QRHPGHCAAPRRRRSRLQVVASARALTSSIPTQGGPAEDIRYRPRRALLTISRMPTRPVTPARMMQRSTATIVATVHVSLHLRSVPSDYLDAYLHRRPTRMIYRSRTSLVRPP